MEEELNEMNMDSMEQYQEEILCPMCGSNVVSLYNSRKMTYHCHSCDCYWRADGVIYDNSFLQSYSGRGSYWNGYTDPDDFPTDGLDGGGW